MIPLINQAVATNIAAHAQMAWTYSVPNDTTAEIVLVNGLAPFYADAERRGGSMTIVDIKVGHVALDVKSRDELSVLIKEPSKRQKHNAPNQDYFKINDSVFVRIPKSIETPVRRPQVDLQNFQGDPCKIMTEQIKEYKDYAELCTQKLECSEIHSVLLLYGKKNGYKALYIEEQNFDVPIPTHFDTAIAGVTMKKGRVKKLEAIKNSSYNGYDKQGRLYELVDFSKGSSIFKKRFDRKQGFLFVWPDGAMPTYLTTPQNWTDQGNFSQVIL